MHFLCHVNNGVESSTCEIFYQYFTPEYHNLTPLQYGVNAYPLCKAALVELLFQVSSPHPSKKYSAGFALTQKSCIYT